MWTKHFRVLYSVREVHLTTAAITVLTPALYSKRRTDVAQLKPKLLIIVLKSKEHSGPHAFCACHATPVSPLSVNNDIIN